VVAGLGAAHAKLAANWVMGELSSALNRDNVEITASRVSPAALKGLLARIVDATISGKIAKDVFEVMWSEGKAADDDHRGARPQANHRLRRHRGCHRCRHRRQSETARRLSRGKDKLFGFFVGQVMKATGGKANPAQLNELLKAKLGSLDA
jgi:aspartyl-tRNA(Asn)/glutamyl-tRNA(Gln) amidotransferase subunit B